MMAGLQNRAGNNIPPQVEEKTLYSGFLLTGIILIIKYEKEYGVLYLEEKI